MTNPSGQPFRTHPTGVTVCGIIGLVFGVIALILSFIPIINNFAFVLGIIGLILAIIGLVGTLRGTRGGKAIAIVATVLSALSLVITLAMQAAASKAIDEAFDAAASQQTGDNTESDHAGADSTADGGNPVSTGKQEMEGDLTGVHVRIVSAVRSDNDYNGQPTVLVTYEWTNTGDENTSFSVATDDAAFQNGQELDVAVYSTTPSGYDAMSTMNELQPGATGTATMGYVLNDDSPVSIEVTDLISFADDAPSVIHTFTL